MPITDVAQGLVELCRKGQFLEAINKYYSGDIVSVEPVSMPNMPAEMSGIDQIRGKNEWFGANNEVHGITVDGPYVGSDQFAARMQLDVTPKHTGQRITMTEMCLYTVKGDKIVREEFYYNAP